MDRYGYYIFLGMGDFRDEKMDDETSEWTPHWDLAEWKSRLGRLRDLGTNILFLYLTGHRLPFRSIHYPQYCDPEHPNVKKDFVQELIDDATGKGIEMVATFSTTGHAFSFLNDRLDLACVGRDGKARNERAVLCHHQPEVREFAANIIDECLDRYRGFSRVILHPPEFHDPCFCELCQKAYADKNGGDLLQVDDAEANRFFIQSNLQFQKDTLEPLIATLLPGAGRLCFTIPWIFVEHYEELARQIPKDTVIVEWNYNLTDQALAELPDRLRRYRKSGHEIWFMPTSGFALDSERNRIYEDLLERVLGQIDSALDAGVNDVVYFTGPKWWPQMEATSYHLNRGACIS